MLKGCSSENAPILALIYNETLAQGTVPDDWRQANVAPILRCNLAFAPRHTKEVAYKTLVRSKLEYAAPIWHPYHESQIGQVEKVQRTAARWTCRRWRNTSSVGDMLDDLEWPSLETRRE